jgi:hypothetical protein
MDINSPVTLKVQTDDGLRVRVYSGLHMEPAGSDPRLRMMAFTQFSGGEHPERYFDVRVDEEVIDVPAEPTVPVEGEEPSGVAEERYADADPDEELVRISGFLGSGAPFTVETTTSGDLIDAHRTETLLPLEAGASGGDLTASALVDRGDHLVVGVLLHSSAGGGMHWARKTREWIPIRNLDAFVGSVEESCYLLGMSLSTIRKFDDARDPGALLPAMAVLNPEE